MTKLPLELLELKELKVINLKYNLLKRIPELIMQFESLQNIYLADNPITNPYEKKIATENNFGKIKEYLLDLSKGITQWKEVKVLILGKEVSIFYNN